MSLLRDGTSPEVLRKQLMGANQRIEVLTAQLHALGATKAKQDPADLNLLERIAWALASAAEASRAVQSVPFDPTGHHTPHPNDRAIPGSSTRAARYQKQKLESALSDALEAWEQARENDFVAPSKARVPKSRCRRRDCPKTGVRVPAWDLNGKPNEYCAGCGDRLPAPEEAA